MYLIIPQAVASNQFRIIIRTNRIDCFGGSMRMRIVNVIPNSFKNKSMYMLVK